MYMCQIVGMASTSDMLLSCCMKVALYIRYAILVIVERFLK
jgi:hypothetical protein